MLRDDRRYSGIWEFVLGAVIERSENNMLALTPAVALYALKNSGVKRVNHVPIR
jgi:hypothetical protein